VVLVVAEVVEGTEDPEVMVVDHLVIMVVDRLDIMVVVC